MIELERIVVWFGFYLLLGAGIICVLWAAGDWKL